MSTHEVACDCPPGCLCEEPEKRLKNRRSFADPTPYGSYELNKRFRHEETRHELIVWDLLLYANRSHICRLIFLVLYHLVFFVLIYLFFTTMLFLFLSCLPNDRPVFGPNMPGLSYSPSALIRSTDAISFNDNDHQDIMPYIQHIDAFLDKLGKSGRERFLNCDLDNAYGYTIRQPCIFIKLNRMLHFKPETYNEAISLPPLAPNELYEDMLPRVTGTYDNRIWLSCSVIEPSPVIIEYVPERFYEAEAFEHPPQKAPDSYNRAGYNYTARSDFRRIVAIKLYNMPLDKLVTIMCTVWAKNIPIDYDTQGKGILHIRVIINRHELRWIGKAMHPKP